MSSLPRPTVSFGGVSPRASSIDVEAWAVEQAAERLQATHISSPLQARGTVHTVEIPLDEPVTVPQLTISANATPRIVREAVHTVHRRSTPVRRDSLKRREALLKGKEGSRRRQRWENDRLLSNPHAQPPLPSDWEVRPTYPVQSVPYFLAPLWDAEFKAKAQEKLKPHSNKTEDPRAHGTKEDQAASRVPKELKSKLKKSRGAKNLLQDLEEEVRQFVEQWDAQEDELEKEGLLDGDSEDEEIVFVGRNGAMSDDRRRAKHDDADQARVKLVYQSLVDDHSAAFGRWLVHSIAQYYGLETWSVTTGNPARREAYVGLGIGRPLSPGATLPQPLWGLV